MYIIYVETYVNNFKLNTSIILLNKYENLCKKYARLLFVYVFCILSATLSVIYVMYNNKNSTSDYYRL